MLIYVLRTPIRLDTHTRPPRTQAAKRGGPRGRIGAFPFPGAPALARRLGRGRRHRRRRVRGRDGGGGSEGGDEQHERGGGASSELWPARAERRGTGERLPCLIGHRTAVRLIMML